MTQTIMLLLLLFFFYFVLFFFSCTMFHLFVHKKELLFCLQGGLETEFFTEYGEASRYQIQEVVGKGSYGVVGSAIDTHTGERVAIKKINDVFEHVSDATRILREIKLLRLLRHPDIVEIKHIMLPPSRREFRDIYVVFELMESDLHQVIKANDDLTPEHYQFFLYQLLRGLKYIHTGWCFSVIPVAFRDLMIID
jgi:serine/threonine protein kinase